MRNLSATNTGRNKSKGWNGIFNFTNKVVSLLDINQSDCSIAYKDIVIKPEVVGDVTSGKVTIRSTVIF